jgi:hypothetical protein
VPLANVWPWLCSSDVLELPSQNEQVRTLLLVAMHSIMNNVVFLFQVENKLPNCKTKLELCLL